MKWTNETKQKAVELLNDSIDIDTIAKEVGMSKSSVLLLKSKTINNYSERIACQICGKKMKQITHRHLASHDISFDDYVKKFPNSRTRTSERVDLSKRFRSPNKGRTYDEIYGFEEASAKRKKISDGQIGRAAPQLAGTGITGTRRDTAMFARSTYEANIDRIFKFENKKALGEFADGNARETLVDNGNTMSYQPDRVDVDGLFCKNAYLEIKGYMYPEDWKKICLFRNQYPNKKLLVISDDKYYQDISYQELKLKYADKIPLWEDSKTNYKTRPDLYRMDYVEPEEVARKRRWYPEGIHVSITDPHKRFIANKCINFNKIAKGNEVCIYSVKLIAISNRRKGATRKSSGEYNYEMWEVTTDCGKTFYVGNTTKTTVFYCYENDRKLKPFFDNNCDMELSCGKK